MLIEIAVLSFLFVFTTGAAVITDRYESYKNKKFQQEKHNVTELSECVICLEQLTHDDIYFLRCGHSYHRKCIRDWFLTRKAVNCPICDH